MKTCRLSTWPISVRNRNFTGSADLLSIYSLVWTLTQICQLSWPEHYFLGASLSSCARMPAARAKLCHTGQCACPCVLTQTDWPAILFVRFSSIMWLSCKDILYRMNHKRLTDWNWPAPGNHQIWWLFSKRNITMNCFLDCEIQIWIPPQNLEKKIPTKTSLKHKYIVKFGIFCIVRQPLVSLTSLHNLDWTTERLKTITNKKVPAVIATHFLAQVIFL